MKKRKATDFTFTLITPPNIIPPTRSLLLLLPQLLLLSLSYQAPIVHPDVTIKFTFEYIPDIANQEFKIPNYVDHHLISSCIYYNLCLYLGLTFIYSSKRYFKKALACILRYV